MKVPLLRAKHARWCILGLLVLQITALSAESIKLLPFQGHITDAQGNALEDGSRVVQFKIYDAPTGGNSVWSGEVQKLSVNAGLVSTILGTKAALSDVDFDRELFLELTIDANDDGEITAADPPLLPRQSIFPAVFAIESADSRKLAGHDWSPLFGNNDPTGTLRETVFKEGSIPGSKLAPNSIDASRITPGSIVGANIAGSTIVGTNIAPGTITRDRLDGSLTADSIIPPGTINAFAGPTAPLGWLLCDGSALSKDDPRFARLFNVIGKGWGDGTEAGPFALYPAVPSGSNMTHFNIPDLRGYFLRGVSGRTGRDPDQNTRAYGLAGGNQGEDVGSVQDSKLPNHVHQWGKSGVGDQYDRPLISWNANGTERTVLSDFRQIHIENGNNDQADNFKEVTSGNDNVPLFTNPGTGSDVRQGQVAPPNVFVHYIIKL